MKRRSLLSGILVAMSYPAIVKASSLMALPNSGIAMSSEIWIPSNLNITSTCFFLETFVYGMNLENGPGTFVSHIQGNRSSEWSHLMINKNGVFINQERKERIVSNAQLSAIRYMKNTMIPYLDGSSTSPASSFINAQIINAQMV